MDRGTARVSCCLEPSRRSATAHDQVKRGGRLRTSPNIGSHPTSERRMKSSKSHRRNASPRTKKRKRRKRANANRQAGKGPLLRVQHPPASQLYRRETEHIAPAWEVGGWVKVPLYMVRDSYLSDGALRAYIALRGRAHNSKPDRARFTHRVIGNDVGRGDWTISRHMSVLESAGYIRRHEVRGRANLYELVAETICAEVEEWQDLSKAGGSQADVDLFECGARGLWEVVAECDQEEPQHKTLRVDEVVRQWRREENRPSHEYTAAGLIGLWCVTYREQRGRDYKPSKSEVHRFVEARFQELIDMHTAGAVARGIELFVRKDARVVQRASTRIRLRAFLARDYFKREVLPHCGRRKQR